MVTVRMNDLSGVVLSRCWMAFLLVGSAGESSESRLIMERKKARKCHERVWLFLVVVTSKRRDLDSNLNLVTFDPSRTFGYESTLAVVGYYTGIFLMKVTN